MSNDFTQQEYDETCELLKNLVNDKVAESGHKSIAMAIAMGHTEITACLYQFQEELNPHVSAEFGIKTKSLFDLFGLDIKLTVSE